MVCPKRWLLQFGAVKKKEEAIHMKRLFFPFPAKLVTSKAPKPRILRASRLTHSESVDQPQLLALHGSSASATIQQPAESKALSVCVAASYV